MSIAQEPEGDLEAQVLRLQQGLRAVGTTITVRANRNRGLLLGLRGDPRTGLRLSVHEDLVNHADAIPLIIAWVMSRGRQLPPGLRLILDAVQAKRRASHRATFPPPLDLPALGSAIDPHAVLKQLHANWFAHLTLPRLVMARQNHKRRQRRIHFATYHRTAATIRLHPRMVEPWVASLFLDYVLFHEMCHHAQAASPLRGETPHSGRFRTWEARFPQLDLALRWERDHLHRFLGG